MSRGNYRFSNRFSSTIGFLHWFFLGVVIMGLLALLDKTELIRLNKIDLRYYDLGFAITEFVIFYKPAELILGSPIIPKYD